MTSLLCTRLFNLLQRFPSDVIKFIIYEYIKEYSYKCSIDNDVMIDNVHYNKQLGIIYVSSKNKCKFINYHDNKLHDSSIIDVRNWKLDFETVKWLNVIYFNYNIIVLSHNNYFGKFILNNKRYNYVNDIYIHIAESICTYDTNIYVCTISPHDSDSYYISIYDTHSLTITLHSIRFNKNVDTKLSMSICDDIIYIVETNDTYLNKIYIHDRNTLNLIQTKCVIRPYLQASPRGILDASVILYKDRLYSYKRNKIHIYDISSLSLIDIFNVKQFDSEYHNHTMIVIDDVIMISNNEEIILYEINQT
jgi:hypothetical protein